MEITDVKIFLVSEKRVKAYASITIDGCFVVRDVKVIEGDNKLFVAMPSKKMKDGSYRDTVHPMDSATRHSIEEIVLEAYRKVVHKAEEE
jgi:stage V sporulation protein G